MDNHFEMKDHFLMDNNFRTIIFFPQVMTQILPSSNDADLAHLDHL